MTAPTAPPPGEFRHEALFYAGEAQFLESTLSFIRGGVAAGEPVLVVVGAEKTRALQAELGSGADGVCFADMAAVGRNPARIIPAWREFVDQHAVGDRRPRGIGEPIWPGRSLAELAECQRHEALLNVAFEGSRPWWLLCPYDTDALDPEVVDEAERTHPFVAQRGTHRESTVCRDLETMAAPFDAPLPEPSTRPLELAFGEHDLAALRRVVLERAERAGLDARQAAELVLAVHELAVNSIQHGGGRGTVRVWPDGDALVCEVADAGHIVEPLVGRRRPGPDQTDGRGLWLVNQLCDLVQLRSYPGGTVVRVHASRDRRPTPPG